MLPRPRYSRLSNHKYEILGLELLKLTAIYGANAAGKSNLVDAIKLLKKFVTDSDASYSPHKDQCKFYKEGTPQVFSVEFIQNGKGFYYGLELTQGNVTTEELYLSGLGKKPDILIFERKTSPGGETSLKFLEEFEKDEKSRLLKSLLIEEFINPGKPILKLLAVRKNTYLRDVKDAYAWFTETLQIIDPAIKLTGVPKIIEKESSFREYAEQLIRSFDVGISSIKVEKHRVKDFFGFEDELLIKEIEKKFENQRLNDSPETQMAVFADKSGNEHIIIKENGELFVEQLLFEHKGLDNTSAKFSLSEESEGTVRLLDFIPAFEEVVNQQKVYFIDEMERSLHPQLIKGLVEKFSKDTNTKGQLIFTTHESALLDQEILRQDEIWFVEKDLDGLTDLYALSDFKEHHTMDIRRGYLSGRFGSVPFLAGLTDLNWNRHAE